MSLKRKVILLLLASILLSLLLAILWGTSPSLACWFPTSGEPRPGINAYRLESGGLERCYLLYLPSSSNPDKPLPLVFSLHGFSSNPHGQRVFSRWEPVAEEHGFVVVYPQGTGYPQRWNADPHFLASTVDDTQLIRDILDDVNRFIAIDQNRIFISGFSNGGAMTLRAACELSETIAAIGTVAAPVTPSLSECTPNRSMPLIAFHGTRDPLVPYEGRTPAEWEAATMRRVHQGSINIFATSIWIEDWAEQNNCDLSQVDSAAGNRYSMLHYAHCDQLADVIFYTIKGGGHTWPGGGWIPFVDLPSRELNASELMWAFFNQHPLP
jgi:polyhydroxybutyrate depolymerase